MIFGFISGYDTFRGYGYDNHQNKYVTTVGYDEIVPVREMFGKNGYLMQAESNRDHTSVDGGVALSNELFNFTAEAEILRDLYKVAFLDDEDNFKNDIVYITEEEKKFKTSIENKTKAEIHRQIFLKLEEMPTDHATLMEEVFNKTVKAKNKEAYVAFFYSLIED